VTITNSLIQTVPNRNNNMRFILIFLLITIFLNSCINRRSGKVKFINSGVVAQGDSIFLLNPLYTYGTFANEVTCCDWYKPSEKQIKIEQQWDSIQSAVINTYFVADFVMFGNRNSNYNQRTFKFIFKNGYKEETESDSISYVVTDFSWSVRDGKFEEAFKFLPDSVIMLSYQKPVAILTNRFRFFDISFRAAYASGTTGLQFVPLTNLIILKEGKIAYFRSYRRAVYYKKIERNPGFIYKFTVKLFDKLK
jgi:hypothetical protein